MPSVELCSRDEVKLYLGITGTTYDTAIGRLVTAASDAVESFCRRRFGEGTYTEYHDGDGKDRIVLANRPVISVTNVWDDPEGEFSDDALLETEEYAVDSARGMLRLRRGRFFTGVGNVKVEYTAGYGTTPEDISQAAVLLAAGWFREGREVVEGARERKGDHLPEAVQALLRPHREAAA